VAIDYWWRGALLGFAIAAPVGPIGLLCIQRTLTAGRLHGLVSGLGAATADALYGCVAGFGLTLIATFLVDQRLWLGLAGGLFLCYLGVRTFQTPPVLRAAQVQTNTLLGAYGSILFLTLTNPMTILSFVAIFSGLGLANRQGDYLAASLLVLGVFCGSAAWWLLLSSGVSFLRGRITPQILRWINRIAGLVIVTLGLGMLITIWTSTINQS
jgi:threonine/homoserine/homoserine lactone efflux protein